MPIQKLPEAVIAQIAAGEVVERPASVVKELVENALDADASTIVVDAQGGGQQLIRVSDDGSGIPAREAELAVARHTTSKLCRADDLARLRTLGFRGEALATIAAVSRLTLLTRHRGEETGVELKLDGGVLRHRRDAGVPAGTIVTVEHLFFNTPARLKFMKSAASERRAILNLISDYAMAYPRVRFVLASDGREVFRSNGQGSLGDVALKVFGLEVFRQMVAVEGGDSIDGEAHVRVSGFVSLPSMHRNDRSRIALFVNGRAVQDQNVSFALTQAYHLLLERGRYPYAVLLLDVPPGFVDVNVHPTKAEVRFEDVNLVFVAVQRAVREALMRHTRLVATLASPARAPLQVSSNAAPSTMFELDETEQVRREPHEPSAPDDEFAYIPTGEERPQRPRTLPPLRVMGQLAASYIVAEGPAGLYLVDQFAASERVAYQQLLDARAAGGLSAQPVSGVTVDLTQAQARLLEGALAAMRAASIGVERFGTGTWKVVELPALVSVGLARDLIVRLVLLLEQGQGAEEALVLALAHTVAYKTGQRLEREQMEALLRALERCPQPLISPSGSATLIHMSRDQLIREFSRRQG